MDIGGHKVVPFDPNEDRLRDFEKRFVQHLRALVRKGHGTVKVTVADNKPLSIEVSHTEK